MFEQRLDLRQPPPPDEVPVFAELRGLGMTDWLGNIFPFGELDAGRRAALPAKVSASSGSSSSVATDRARRLRATSISPSCARCCRCSPWR